MEIFSNCFVIPAMYFLSILTFVVSALSLCAIFLLGEESYIVVSCIFFILAYNAFQFARKTRIEAKM